jgi:hypothetical protein
VTSAFLDILSEVRSADLLFLFASFPFIFRVSTETNSRPLHIHRPLQASKTSAELPAAFLEFQDEVMARAQSEMSKSGSSTGTSSSRVGSTTLVAPAPTSSQPVVDLQVGGREVGTVMLLHPRAYLAYDVLSPRRTQKC